MKRRWMLPAAAAALALVTTLAIIQYLQGVAQRAAVVAPVKTETVVVARTNIAERQVVRGDLLEVRQVPVEAVHPQAARRLDEVVNRVAIAPIFADEQVLVNKLATAGVNVGLSYVMPKDKRAMTIAVNEVVGVAGFVFPGDRVDVLGTVRLKDENFTKIVLQNVEVLAIAQKVEQKPGEEPRVTTSATLALDPQQAEALAQIDNSGRLRLALRPYGATERVQTAGMTLEAALGRRTAPAVQAAPRPAPRTTTAVRPARRPAAVPPPPLPPVRTQSVEIWRATQRSMVEFREGSR
ncbi:MAG: Flp pilus assembly protein CpaB [Armatimonadota bacterium]|nr:Flp pilus assembly protein CpaB [Armatimonadota bacterium]